MMLGLLPLYPSVPMSAAAPDSAPPQRIGDEKFKKTPCPLCHREALMEGVLRREDDFHGPYVNRINSYLFL